MSGLEIYTKTAKETTGTQHMWTIQALRKYLKLCPDQEAILAINRITDVEQLRILIEAGMRTPLHQTVISRINLLVKEQQEAKR